MPGGWPGAGHSLGTVTQQMSVPLSPFPSPPAALAALTSTSCSVKATLQREKRSQGWRHPGECPLQTPLGCSQGAGHHQKWWPKSPSPGERNGVKVQSLDHVVPCDPPGLTAPRGMWVLTGPTCASLVSPALRARWGNSAVAPLGFLHLQGGSKAAGETTREGFSLAFPPLSALLSPAVGPSQSFPQHQGGCTPPFPMSPPKEMMPVRPHCSHTRPQLLPGFPTLGRGMGTHPPSSVPSLSPVHRATSCLSVPGAWGAQGHCQPEALPSVGPSPNRAAPRSWGSG